MNPYVEAFVERNRSDLVVSARTRPKIGGMNGTLESGFKFVLTAMDLGSIADSGRKLYWRLPDE